MRSFPSSWLVAVLVPFAALVGTPSAAAAQEPAAETLVPGRRSITFEVVAPGAASFGIWKMRSETTNLGILVDASIGYRQVAVEGEDNDRSTTRFFLAGGPEVRRYTSVSGRVAPYGFVGGRIGFNYSKTTFEPDFEEDAWSALLNGRFGLGADFFPVRNLSLGAQIGVGATLRYQPHESPAGDATEVDIDLRTFGASLGGAIWF